MLSHHLMSCLLQKAKQAGDFLLVGIHTDEDVTERRGPHLPIMGLHERALSVLSCRYVDEVVIGGWVGWVGGWVGCGGHTGRPHAWAASCALRWVQATLHLPPLRCCLHNLGYVQAPCLGRRPLIAELHPSATHLAPPNAPRPCRRAHGDH